MRLPIAFILCLFSFALFAQKVSDPTNSTTSGRWINEAPENVIFYEGFENVSLPTLPYGWSTESVSLEGFVTGTAGISPGQTNSNGYWPVPAHGIFAMTNDDVCNCNKTFDRLTSRTFNLSTKTYLKVIFDAFQNGSSAQEAWLEVKRQNGAWTKIYEIHSSARWETHETVVPNYFLREGFQLRFRYSDNGNYASGLAVDDIYLVDEPTSAFKLSEFFAVDASVPGSGQGYELMPLGQAQYARLRFGALISNDSEKLKNAELKVSIQGPLSYLDSTSGWNLAPLTEDYVRFTSRNRFTPYQTGDYTVSVSLKTDSTDSNDDDNSAEMHIGVQDSVYARLAEGSDGTGIWLDETGERVGSVFQFFRGDTIKAVKVNIHPASVVGSRFRVKVFSYDTLTSSLISSSPVQITQNDLGGQRRIELNDHVGAGKLLIALENETGSVIFYGSTKTVAENGNALSYQPGSPWKPFPYFVDLEVITKDINEACPGHFQYAVDDQSCPGLSDGKIKAEILDANLPWTYSWSNGAGNIDSIENLNPGSYQVIVTDGSGCIYDKLFQVRPADSIQFNPTIVADSCGKSDGRIDLNIAGGTGPYSILWNGTNGLNFQSDLSKGDYLIEVTDNNGCHHSESITLPGTDPIGIAFTIFAAGCNDSNGFAAVTPFGTGPFSFMWNDGQSNDTIVGLESGVYSITLTDSIGCETSGRAFVPDSNAPSIGLQNHMDIVCTDSSNGAININVSGGTPGYTYNWNNGSTTEDLTGLIAGTYDLQLTDANGCKNFFAHTINNESSPIILDLYAKGNYCDGESKGKIQALANGGSPEYSFLWSTGEDTSYIAQLSAGSYTVTLTDNNGCQVSNEISIAEGNPIIIDIDSIVYDTGGSILFENKIYATAYGGVPPFSYIWNDSVQTKDLINVDSGAHQLEVRDQLGCTQTLIVNIGEGPSGVNDIEVFGTKIFPNPLLSGQILNVTANETIRLIEFINVHGQTVFSSRPTVSSLAQQIAIPRLTEGLYLVRIATESSSETKRLLYYQ